MAIELIQIAEKYEVLDMKQQAHEYVKLHLNKLNVMEALVTVSQFELQDIEQEILDYITYNLKWDNEIVGLNGNVSSDILIKIIYSIRKYSKKHCN